MRKFMIAALLATGIAAASAATTTPPAAPLSGADQFKAECSACHIAFPAGFLPKRSWEALMGNLTDHFGEDASLAPESVAAITEYLLSHANDAGGKQRGFARRLAADQTPLRITELPGFKREHGGFSKATMDKVKTLSNCVACHRGAAQGVFEDD